jgi:VCBS repeat protein
MKNMISKTFRLVGFLCCLLLPTHVSAQEIRVGLATYEVVSGENVDYLKKAVYESLSVSLQGKGNIKIVEISQTEEELKKKGISKILKNEGLAALLTGSVVKVGAPVQINTRVYGPGGTEPVLVSHTADQVDRLLPTLQIHAQAILDQLDRTTIAEPVLEKKETKPQAPVIPPAGGPSPKPTEEKPSVKEAEKKSTKKEAKEAKVEVPTPIASMPDYRWMSERLPYEGRGLAYADLDGDGKAEVITIDLNHVYVYELGQNQVRLLKSYAGEKTDQFVRVHTMDLDGDSKSEILVSNIRNGQASSFGLRDAGGELKTIFSKAPWLLKVTEWEGKPLLVGEPFTGREVNYHKISKLILLGGKLKEEGELSLPQNIGLYGFREFQTVSQEAGGLIYLTPSGYLQVYEEGKGGDYKKRSSSTERYGGSSNSINLPVRNVFNEVEKNRTYFNLEPVVWREADGRGAVLVAKNDNFLKNVIGTEPIVKNCWFSKLKWEDLGLREAWNTRKVDGYIADYLRANLPGENSPKLLTLLWLRDPGFANTMGTFKSVLAVYDLN